MSGERPAESFEARLALVCEDAPERQAVMKGALEQIGFTMLAVKNADEAIARLRRDVYELVIIDEHYQGATPLDNAVLAAVRPMTMAQRRWMFVALVGREFKTFDNAMAFARSVNVVVNVNDLPHLPAILKKGITEHVEFYRAFRQVLTDAGKKQPTRRGLRRSLEQGDTPPRTPRSTVVARLTACSSLHPPKTRNRDCAGKARARTWTVRRLAALGGRWRQRVLPK